MKKIKESQKAWDKFLKPIVNTQAPVISMDVGAESKNPEVGQATTSILRSISGGKVLGHTDMHGNRICLREF